MAEHLPYRLILGSGSWGRRELLSRAGYTFEVVPAGIDEPDTQHYPDARTMVQHIAWLKAAALAPRIDAGVILTADTVGWVNGQAIGKPADEADARRILRLLSGTEHELWTGVCLWRRPGDVQLAWQEKSRVAMTAMAEAEIDAYFITRIWQGCSGAYAIQEEDDPYVRVIEGSISNVVGLPMETVTPRLRQMSSLR